jgi:GldM C-terminal domain
MKTVFKTLLLSFLSTSSYAQTVAFAADKMNVLYIGVDNPLTIVVENIDCSKIKVVTNNGTIEGKNCYFIARPMNYGTASITATYKHNGKTKYVVCNYRVKEIPPPTFKIGTGQKRLPLVTLKSQQFVRADLENVDIDVTFSIDSFTVSTFSKETATYKQVKNIGRKISAETKQLFDSIKVGDEILFKDIFSHKFNGEVFMLEPVLIAVY